MSLIGGNQINNNHGDVNNVQGTVNTRRGGDGHVKRESGESNATESSSATRADQPSKRARRNSNTRELDQISAAFGKSLSAHKFFTTVDRRKPVHDTLLIDSTGEGAFLDLLCKTPQDTAVARAKGSDGMREAFDRWLNAGNSLLEFVAIVRVREQANLAAELAKHDARLLTLYERLVVPGDEVPAARDKVKTMVKSAKQGKQYKSLP